MVSNYKEESSTKLPQELKSKVIEELEFIIQKMSQEQDIDRKIYFYSALRGVLERASRSYYDRELLVAHTIVDVSYSVINDRIAHLRSGDLLVPFPENSLNQLIQGVSDLKQAIENNEEIYPAVEILWEVAYLATGPGFYTRSLLDYVSSKQHSQEELKQ